MPTARLISSHGEAAVGLFGTREAIGRNDGRDSGLDEAESLPLFWQAVRDALDEDADALAE